jgi:starch phosphorylase
VHGVFNRAFFEKQSVQSGAGRRVQAGGPEFGVELDDLFELEPDAGLGNGGLGRLAACYLDSAAGLGYPVAGYSIRYDYGVFRQKIVDCWQTEMPDNWLPGGDVWLSQRIDESVKISFDGTLSERWVNGRLEVSQNNASMVMAIPYDMMIPGYGGQSVGVLRLWSARYPDFDFNLFSSGNYMQAMEESAMAEVISKVLYPSDKNIEGKSLRLRQQYFLVSASVQDIVNKHLAAYGSLDSLPDKVVIHINETHPALAVPELMRLMLDKYGYGWDKAWDIVRRTTAYTNHTIMSEALEVWPESLFRGMLPRIYEIVREINERFCRGLLQYYPNDLERISRMAVMSYGHIHMANLCTAACFSINGVSKIHSRIVRSKLFPDYSRIFPDKFTNVTNGIAHRRWLCQANPKLSALIEELIGPAFIQDAERLTELKKYAGDEAVLSRLGEIKRANKEQFAAYMSKTAGLALNPAPCSTSR